MTRPMQADLAGKVAVVTGSTQGVGEAIARRVVAWGGAGVVVTGRNRARGEAVVRSLEQDGGRAVFVAADAADPGAAAAMIAAASTERGGLLDTNVAFIDTMFAVNVRTPMLLMQAAAKLILRHGEGGAMVNILSMNVHCGAPDLAVYSATKGAMATLTRNAANAFAPDRIRVNGINLGWADTPAERALQERISPHGTDWLAQAGRGKPFGRLIAVDEVADLAAFLLSANAGVMTGSLIDCEQNVLGAPPG